MKDDYTQNKKVNMKESQHIGRASVAASNLFDEGTHHGVIKIYIMGTDSVLLIMEIKSSILNHRTSS